MRKFSKRIFDIVFSLLLITVTLPIQLVIALLLILIMRENPFFVQERGITLEGKLFRMLKFKTMNSVEKQFYIHHNPKEIFLLPNLAVELNVFTRWLRKSGMDELPQLYNVLLGEMSMVGPRPLMIQDLEIMKKEFPGEYQLRSEIKLKPGITGIWQLIGERNLGVENLVSYDLYYDHNQSVLLDIQILFVTIPIVFFAMNSDAIIPRLNLVRNFFNLTSAELIVHGKDDSLIDKKKYSIQIPSNWWYVSNTYSVSRESAKIFYLQMNTSKQKIAK